MQGREGAAEEDGAVGLDGDGIDGAVRVGIEIGIHGAVGVEARDEVAHGRVPEGVWRKAVEGATYDNLAVEVEREGVDGTGGAWIKGVERAVRLEPGEVVARRGRGGRGTSGIEGGERSAGHDLTVGLEEERVNGRAGRRVVGGIERTGAVETRDEFALCRSGSATRLHGREGTAEHNFAVTLDDDGVDAGIEVRVERGVEGAVRIKAGRAVAGRVTDAGKRTADEDLLVGLDGDCRDFSTQWREKAAIKDACRRDADEIAVGGLVFIREHPAEEDIAVGFYGDGFDGASEFSGQGKSGAQGAIPGEPSEAVALRRDGGGVRAMEHRGDRAIGIEGRGEQGVGRALGVETRYVGRARAADIGKRAHGDDLAVGLLRQ